MATEARGLEIGSVLSEAWGLYRRFFRRFVALAALVFVVLGLVQALVTAAAGDSILAALVWGLVGAAVSLIGFFWVQGALVEAVRDVRDGRVDSTLGEVFAAVRPRLPALIVAGILAGIGVMIGFVLLVIPGLFLLTRWVLIVPVIVLEGRSAGEAFSRSWELVKGHGWSVFGLIVVTVVALALIGAIIGGIVGIVLAFLPTVAIQWAANIVTNSLLAPFVALAWTVAYYRLTGEPTTVETPAVRP